MDASGASGGRKYSFLSTASGATFPGAFAVYDSTAAAYRMLIDSTGKIAIGGAFQPLGPLHVAGVGGGMLYFSATAVNGTIQTPVAAGSIGVMAVFFGMIRNNGGSSTAFLGFVNGNGLALSQSFVTSVSSAADQVTTTLTGTGAITVQRTAGANSHEVNMLVFYK
jgi:hypothetical protein